MTEKLKAAVIGCGSAARIDHIRWYAEHPDVTLVGLADVRGEAAEECAAKWGGAPYTDADQMLTRERPDVVSVCSPVALHLQHTVMAIEHGCHVLCEKPMAPTLEACDQMIAAAARADKLLGIAFHKRFNVGTEELRRRLLAGEIGDPIFVRNHWMMFGSALGGFRGELITGGGVFQDHGAHWIDQFRWWIGDLISVSGQMMIWHQPLSEVEDHAVSTFEFANGCQGAIEASRVAPTDTHGQTEDTYLYGSDGAFFISLPPWTHYHPPILRQWDRSRNEWSTIALPADMLSLNHYHYKRQIEDWVRCVREGDAPRATGIDGRKAIEAILATYLSHDAGQRVTLPLEESPDLTRIFSRLREACRARTQD